MNSLKLFSYTIYFVLACGIVLYLPACNDPCKNKMCDHGYCIEGDCFCLDGYSGENCEIKESDKFVGSYAGQQFCPEGPTPIQVKITNKSEDPRRISIFIDSYGVEIVLNANIDRDSIFIPNQWVEITYENTTITNLFNPSKGSIRNDSIKFDLIYFYKKNDIDTCRFDLKKI